MNNLCGWVSNPAEVERIAQSHGTLTEVAPGLKDSGAGKDAFIFEIERQLTGSVRDPHNQTIGDCTSHGLTGAAEDLQFVQIAKDPTLKFQWLSSETIYGLARHQIGHDACGSGDGAVVAWVVQAAQQYGLLARGVYGSYNLSAYSGAVAHQFGAPRVGCPQPLVDLSKPHLLLQAALIDGDDKYSQARDVIANGGLIVTGSNQLYSQKRDAQGFCSPSGSGGHCTYYRGFTDNAKRPGIVYQQSWGKDTPVGGPATIVLPSSKSITLPAGAFFIDADNFNKMHRQGEVWAITVETGWVMPDSEVKFAFHL